MKKLVLSLIRFYKKNVSPARPPSCRFTPTCSEYAIEAIEKHGLIKGGAYAVKRVLKCNPLFKGGYDPVPEVKEKKIIAQKQV